MTDAKTAHVVETPQYFFFIRIAQFIFSIIILGLVGYTIDVAGSGSRSQLGEVNFMVFCCIWTWLVIAYVFVSTLWLPVAYNMWVQLAAEVLATIFWLCGWAATAAWAADWAPWFEGLTEWTTVAAAAGLGALIWILFMITTITFCMRLHRHRTDPANAHLSKYGTQMNEKGTHELGHVPQGQVYANAGTPAPEQQFAQQQQNYPHVQPTPPPQGWSQSPPPPQQYAQV